MKRYDNGKRMREPTLDDAPGLLLAACKIEDDAARLRPVEHRAALLRAASRLRWLHRKALRRTLIAIQMQIYGKRAREAVRE